MATTDIDDVLALIGFGRLQICMVFACGMTGIYVNNEVLGLSTLYVSIGCDLLITESEMSVLSTAGLFGFVISAHLSGYKTDKIGRRKVILYSLFLTMVASTLSVAMQNFHLLVLGRFVTGLFVSGAGINTLTYITEFTQVRMRPRVVNFVGYAFAIGSMYMPVLAHLLEPLNRQLFAVGSFSVHYWRLNLILNLIPGLIAFISMVFLPETATFLLLIGEHDRAYKALNRLCRSNRKQNLESLGVGPLSQASHYKLVPNQTFFKSLWSDMIQFAAWTYFKNILLLTCIISGYSFVGYGLSLWATKLHQHHPDGEMIFCESVKFSAFGCDSHSVCSGDTYTYTFGIALGCINLLICIVITIVLFWLHRTFILFCNASFAVISGLSLNLVTNKYHIFCAMIFFISLCTGSIALTSSVITDVVPTHLRGKAVSFAYMIARISVILASHIIGHTMLRHCLFTLNVFVIVIAIVAIIILFLPKKDFVAQ